MDDEKNFANDSHALRTGMLLGLLLKSGITVWPGTDDEGNYTDTITVVLDNTLPLFTTKVEVRVLPPSDDD